MADSHFLEDVSVEGAAFPLLIKILASLLMLALFFWGYQAAQEIAKEALSWSALAVIGASLIVCSMVYYWILNSRTSIEQGVIAQTWLWNKRVAVRDVTQAKFIYIPYLSWLIAPRLVVRVGMGVYVFHAASPRVLEAFARLSLGPLHPTNQVAK